MTKVFDQNPATRWLVKVNQTPSITYDFSGTTAQTVKLYYVGAGNDLPDRDPVAWVLEGSNNGTSWTAVDTRTNQSFVNRYALNSYSISNTTAYQMYRFRVTANNESADFQISELQLFGGSAGVQIAASSMSANSGQPGNLLGRRPEHQGCRQRRVGLVQQRRFRRSDELPSAGGERELPGHDRVSQGQRHRAAPRYLLGAEYRRVADLDDGFMLIGCDHRNRDALHRVSRSGRQQPEPQRRMVQAPVSSTKRREPVTRRFYLGTHPLPSARAAGPLLFVRRG
jgi:hypothetical protein